MPACVALRVVETARAPGALELPKTYVEEVAQRLRNGSGGKKSGPGGRGDDGEKKSAFWPDLKPIPLWAGNWHNGGSADIQGMQTGQEFLFCFSCLLRRLLKSALDE